MTWHLYASEIACQAADLHPTGHPHAGEAASCATCGRPLTQGMLVVPNDPPRSFSDHHKLLSSNFICGWCNTIRKQDVLRAFQRCVITPIGTYSMGKDESRTWFWLTPPNPPFVLVINSNTTGAFHYVWQTPVTLDNRLIQATVDGVTVQIRHSAILKAVEVAEMLKQRLIEAGHKKGFNSPFQVLSRGCFRSITSGHGRVKKSVLEMALKDASCRDAVDFLQGLSSGELWALSAMLKEKPVPPLAPELIRGRALFKEKAEEVVEVD
ncbi:hypothetical protein KBW71_01160 [Hydrogenophaga aromaticivorans]|uniref:type IV CRISPR-associated protein Csf1 n=1 Tax=Hydrogenophaga aromaticivorans TaxID=2610898 RepID=UPI001B36EF52|nr:type IV CRISPR-associated protein Csf1 [Hydrogenophaga aromaticivorans]MBQ0917039.1 hypothetical protein [Hydrogenophaga aromaticivorans]